MKRTVIILVIIMLVSFIVAVILAGTQLQNMDTFQLKTIEVNKSKEVELSKKLNNIKVDSCEVSNVNILSIQGNKIKVTLNGSYDTIMDRRIDIYVDNMSSNLKISVEMLKFLRLGDYRDDLTLNIYIPESYKKKLEIEGFYSNLNVEEKVSDNVKINGINRYKQIEDEIEKEIDLLNM